MSYREKGALSDAYWFGLGWAMIRKLIGLPLACGLVIAGASAVLYWLGNGGRVVTLIAGIFIASLGLFWIKEDWVDRRLPEKSSPPDA